MEPLQTPLCHLKISTFWLQSVEPIRHLHYSMKLISNRKLVFFCALTRTPVSIWVPTPLSFRLPAYWKLEFKLCCWKLAELFSLTHNNKCGTLLPHVVFKLVNPMPKFHVNTMDGELEDQMGKLMKHSIHENVTFIRDIFPP